MCPSLAFYFPKNTVYSTSKGFIFRTSYTDPPPPFRTLLNGSINYWLCQVGFLQVLKIGEKKTKKNWALWLLEIKNNYYHTYVPGQEVWTKKEIQREYDSSPYPKRTYFFTKKIDTFENNSSYIKRK